MKGGIQKIGLVCAHSFARPGGVQRHVVSLYEQFRMRGLEVKIIAPGSARPKGIEEREVICLGKSFAVPGNGSKTNMNFSFKPRAIERVLEREQFDILHFHNMDVGLLTWQVLRASRSTNILTFHGALDGSRMMRWFPWLKEIGRMVYEPKIDGAIGVSGVAFEILKNFSGPKVIIPNGVDLQRFSPDGE
jgi:phosphatidylinositol alpha-mannosyltransferase